MASEGLEAQGHHDENHSGQFSLSRQSDKALCKPVVIKSYAMCKALRRVVCTVVAHAVSTSTCSAFLSIVARSSPVRHSFSWHPQSPAHCRQQRIASATVMVPPLSNSSVQNNHPTAADVEVRCSSWGCDATAPCHEPQGLGCCKLTKRELCNTWLVPGYILCQSPAHSLKAFRPWPQEITRLI